MNELTDILIPIVMFIIVAAMSAFGASTKRRHDNETRGRDNDYGRSKSTDTAVTRSTQSKRAQPSAFDRTTPSARPTTNVKSSLHTMHSSFDAEEKHTHKGMTESEKVEPIVGSLGEVNDEGCAELGGIRYITPITIEDDDNKSFDLDRIATAIVLGDVLSHPKGME